VIPIFTGIVITPFLMGLDMNIYLKFIGVWWVLVGFLNAVALYFIKKRKIKAAKYTYTISATVSFFTGAAFWIVFFMTLVCISMIHRYERM
jgi:hypothetical protein